MGEVNMQIIKGIIVLHIKLYSAHHVSPQCVCVCQAVLVLCVCPLTVGQTNPVPDVDPEEPEEVTEAVCLESELQDGQ